MKSADMQMTLGLTDEEMELYDPTNDTGYKMNWWSFPMSSFSKYSDLAESEQYKTFYFLVKDLGRCSLDIEMETGTGKTYVYIKTMFELNKNTAGASLSLLCRVLLSVRA